MWTSQMFLFSWSFTPWGQVVISLSRHMMSVIHSRLALINQSISGEVPYLCKNSLENIDCLCFTQMILKKWYCLSSEVVLCPQYHICTVLSTCMYIDDEHDGCACTYRIWYVHLWFVYMYIYRIGSLPKLDVWHIGVDELLPQSLSNWLCIT